MIPTDQQATATTHRPDPTPGKPGTAGSTAGSSEYGHLMPLFTELAGCAEGEPRREELRRKLIEGHMPLAAHIAWRYAGRGEPREDLEQVATLGLVNAVDRFDPGRETDFLSFAVPTITGEVRRHFRDTSWAMRVPRRLKDLHVSLSAAITTLSQRLGHAPTAAELAEHLDMPIEEILEGMQATRACHLDSLDGMLANDESGTRLGDLVGRLDHGMDMVEHRQALYPLLRRLPDRERTILVLRFFHGMTQTEIATRVGISQMHVSRLLSRTLRQLREWLGQLDGSRAGSEVA